MAKSWRFTSEQEDFAEAVRAFCRREVGTKEQRDAYTEGGLESHSPELYRKLAATGYIGVSLPEEYGGSGGGLIEQFLLFEELWYGMAPVHGTGTTHTCAGIYKRFGSETQKKRVISAMSGGTLYSISISEPGAGSDLSGIACKAEKVDGGYRINGQKTWCSDAHFADWILVDRPHRPRGQPAQGPVDAQGSGRRRRRRGPPDLHHGRQERSTTSSSPTSSCPTTRSSVNAVPPGAN